MTKGIVGGIQVGNRARTPRACSVCCSCERGATDDDMRGFVILSASFTLYLPLASTLASVRVGAFIPPKPASLRDAGFATLEVALGSASPGPCVALCPCAAL